MRNIFAHGQNEIKTYPFGQPCNHECACHNKTGDIQHHYRLTKDGERRAHIHNAREYCSNNNKKRCKIVRNGFSKPQYQRRNKYSKSRITVRRGNL